MKHKIAQLQKISVCTWTFSINARSAHGTIESNKEMNEITPVYVLIEIHLYSSFQHFKFTKCDIYKINCLLKGVFCARSIHFSSIKVCGRLSVTLYVLWSDLVSYPVKYHVRLWPQNMTLTLKDPGVKHVLCAL
jgi:hypothetical protein